MIRSLQACRGLAVLLVVLHHTSNGIFVLPKYFAGKPLGNVFDFGEAGVDFFLVLSGFIITYVHRRDIGRPDRLRSYAWKRLTRIYPTYWAALLPLVPIYFLVPQFGLGYERDLDSILCSFLLVPHPHHPPILGVAWTLLLEFFFYFVFAVLVANRRVGIAATVAWFALILASRYWAPLTAFPYSWVTNEYHLRFLAGIALAAALPYCPPLPAPRLLVVLGAAVLLWTGLTNAYGIPWNLYQPTLGYTPSCVFLIVALIHAERAGFLRVPELLVHIGDASYSIYLVHFPALSLLAKGAKGLHADRWLPASVLFVLIAAGAILISYTFYRVIEVPLRRLVQPKERAASAAERASETRPEHQRAA